MNAFVRLLDPLNLLSILNPVLNVNTVSVISHPINVLNSNMASTSGGCDNGGDEEKKSSPPESSPPKISSSETESVTSQHQGSPESGLGSTHLKVIKRASFVYKGVECELCKKSFKNTSAAKSQGSIPDNCPHKAIKKRRRGKGALAADYKEKKRNQDGPSRRPDDDQGGTGSMMV